MDVLFIIYLFFFLYTFQLKSPGNLALTQIEHAFQGTQKGLKNTGRVTDLVIRQAPYRIFENLLVISRPKQNKHTSRVGGYRYRSVTQVATTAITGPKTNTTNASKIAHVDQYKDEGW